MNKYFRQFILLSFFVSPLFLGCDLVPSLNKEPKISFKQITTTPVFINGLRSDSVVIAIDYEDGDGNLGLDPNETEPPFQRLQPNGDVNPFSRNFFITPYKKINGEFVRANLPQGADLNGRFPLLNAEGKAGPIEGTINYDMIMFGYFPVGDPLIVQPKDTLRFEVQIADRDLNLSNTVMTDPIVFMQ